MHYQNESASAERVAATLTKELRQLLLQQSRLYDKVDNLYHTNRGALNPGDANTPSWPQSPRAVGEKVNSLLGLLERKRA
jgi:hypothetical protein